MRVPIPYVGWLNPGHGITPLLNQLRVVDGYRWSRFREEVGDDRTQLGGIPTGALVDLRAVRPSFGNPDQAALDLEDPSRDVARFVAAEPHHEWRDVLRGHWVEAIVGAGRHLGEHRLGHPGAGARGDRVHSDAV